MSSLENSAGSLEGWLERSSSRERDERDGRCGFWKTASGFVGERWRILRGGGRGISLSMIIILAVDNLQVQIGLDRYKESSTATESTIASAHAQLHWENSTRDARYQPTRSRPRINGRRWRRSQRMTHYNSARNAAMRSERPARVLSSVYFIRNGARVRRAQSVA